MPDPSPPASPDAILGPGAKSVPVSAESENGGDRKLKPSGGVSDSPARAILEPDADRRCDAEVGSLVSVSPAAQPKEALPAVSSKKSRDTALIAQRDARIQRNAQKIVDAAMLAPTFDESGPRPEGMTDFQYRCAKANWLPIKLQPGFLAMAQRTLESYRKAEADKPAAPTINAGLVQINITQASQPARIQEED